VTHYICSLSLVTTRFSDKQRSRCAFGAILCRWRGNTKEGMVGLLLVVSCIIRLSEGRANVFLLCLWCWVLG